MAAGPAAAPESPPPLCALARGAPPPPPPQLLSASLNQLLLRLRRVLCGLGLRAGSELGRGWQSAAAHARAPSFSAPPGAPSARAYIATGRRCSPPRGWSMTALGSGSGIRNRDRSVLCSASSCCCRVPARVAPGAQQCFAYTQCTPGTCPFTSAGGWARTGRRGQGSRNVGRRGACLPSSQEQFIRKVPSTPVHSRRVAQQGDPGEGGCGLERSLQPSPPPGPEMLVGGDWYARGSAPSKLRGSPPSLSHLAAWPEFPKFWELFQRASTPMVLVPD